MNPLCQIALRIAVDKLRLMCDSMVMSILDPIQRAGQCSDYKRSKPRSCDQCGNGIPWGGNQPCVICRFWSHVQKLGPNECWIWTGPIAEPGYGKIGSCGQRVYAHRLAWELANGPWDSGLFVLHKCDNKVCCNPNHLYLGTQAENMRDRDERGRSGTAKLNRQAVKVIRWAWKRGVRQKRLAELHGISASLIWMIVHGRSWRGV